MSTDINFQSLVGNKSNWQLLQQLHKALLSTGKDIAYRIFPIYIRYEDGDRTIALLYFKGKHLELGELELGLNIGAAKLPKGFDNGERMKYPEINCSVKLATSSRLTKELLDVLKLTKQ